MGDLNKQELRRLAEAATGGDWEYRLGLIRTMPDSDGYVPVAVAPNAPKNWRPQRDTNMQYIAEAHPSVILALLDELAQAKCESGHAIQQKDAAYAECKALREDAERYRWLRDSSESIHQFYLSTPIWFTGVKFSKENVDSTIDAAMSKGDQQ